MQNNTYPNLQTGYQQPQYAQSSQMRHPDISSQMRPTDIRTKEPPSDIIPGEFQHSFCNCCSDGFFTCMTSWLCGFSFLNASTRRSYDESNYCFNCCCLTGAMARNMIREGYEIEGNCCSDVILSTCFPCCSAIQLRSEVEARGRR